MKKLFRILMCGAMLLTVASSAFIVSKAILDKSDDVVEANAAADGTFGMYYAGGSSATLRQYSLAGTLPTDISTNVMDTVAYTSGLSSYSPDGGTRADTRTYTTVSFTEARVMVIPVRLAVNVNAYSKKKLKSFSGSISVSRTTSSKPAAKIELLHSLTSGFTVKSAINTSSSNVTASTYIQSGSTVGSTSFSFNNGGNGIEFLNTGSSAGPIIYDNFYLIFSMPTRDSSCQYVITMSITNHDIEDLGNYVAYDSSNIYYNQSEFEDALTSQGTATNTFTLTKDFTLEKQLTFSNITRTINFTNHRIYTAVDEAFVIGSGSNVTFNGNNGSSLLNSGGIYSQTSGNSLILMQTGILTINSGMYGVLNVMQGTGLGYVIKNLSPSGTLYINGGKFCGTYDVYDTGGLVYYIGGGTFQAETQCIFNSSTYGLICIFGEPTFNKPLSIAKYINLNNNNAITPLYYTGSGTIELTIANNLKSANQTIASGAQSEAILSNIVITNIENTGYVREIVSGSGTYGLRLANYSCTPILHLSNCSVVGDVPVMTFSASSGASFPSPYRRWKSPYG